MPPKLRILECHGSHCLPPWGTLGLWGVGRVGSEGQCGVFTGLGQDGEEQHGKCHQLVTPNLFASPSLTALV